MCDALTLAVEEGADAVVDIATLTGGSLMALGQLTAALFGTNHPLVNRVRDAAAHADEQVRVRYPYPHRTRPQFHPGPGRFHRPSTRIVPESDGVAKNSGGLHVLGHIGSSHREDAGT